MQLLGLGNNYLTLCINNENVKYFNLQTEKHSLICFFQKTIFRFDPSETKLSISD